MEPAQKHSPDKVRRRKRKWKIIVVVIGVLVCVRLALPFVILHYANQKLASLDGYYGHVNDVDLWLYRGAYVIKDVYIKKVDNKDTSDFFSCPHVDLSVEWRAIFQKKLVGEVEFEQPILEYIMGKNIGKGKIKEDSTNFIQLVKDFMPLRINHFDVTDGEIHYEDFSKSPKVDVPMTHVNIDGTGLTNEQDTALLPASIKMNADLYNGKFTVNTRLAPLNDVPTFDLNATLTNTDLTKFNDFFRAYANCDVEKGSMGLYVEMAAKDNEFAGYVKPVIQDLKVLDINKDDENLPHLAWEGLVAGVAEVLTNQPKDQFAAKIPISGRFTKPDVGIIEAIVSILQNAFIQAIQPSLDNSISIGTVHEEQEKKGFFDRLFDKDDKSSKKQKKKKK